jgi:hypothetical protein
MTGVRFVVSTATMAPDNNNTANAGTDVYRLTTNTYILILSSCVIIVSRTRTGAQSDAAKSEAQSHRPVPVCHGDGPLAV